MKQVRLFGSDDDTPVLAPLELAKAEKVASQIEASIKPLCDKIRIVGSIRRKKPFVGDCDFVVLAADGNWARIVHALRKPKVTRAGCRKLANETKKVVRALSEILLLAQTGLVIKLKAEFQFAQILLRKTRQNVPLSESISAFRFEKQLEKKKNVKKQNYSDRDSYSLSTFNRNSNNDNDCQRTQSTMRALYKMVKNGYKSVFAYSSL